LRQSRDWMYRRSSTIGSSWTRRFYYFQP
jgi:hypothetical protein